ncbi:MAG TPA: SUMF1/EgtB/PvdO family nonheme iron enzyme [Vicinamibacterales bacterium]|nr:SUMF1/EgtB/PvdO family nonheme iron enzyme [Vicinamibacterales bacterium]
MTRSTRASGRTMARGAPVLDRSALIDWYTRNRERSRRLFDLVTDEAYYSRPISLRHPLVFYEGHLPAFSFNTLVKRGLGERGIDARLEALFARGIDPHESQAASLGAERAGWPSREEVQQFADEADRRVMAALRSGDIERPGHPLLDRAEAAYAILEHEAMHQETLLYMWHRLPVDQKRRPAGYDPVTAGAAPRQEWMEVPAGRATLGIDAGARPFSWDNERPAHRADVPAFAMHRHDVTSAAYLEFVDAGGYADPAWWRPEDWRWLQADHRRHPLFWERQDDAWHWRGMFDLLPLPLAWPAYVSYAEALAYARWRGVRLPTEAEFQRAAYGTPTGAESPFPWGDADPAPEHGVLDFRSWDPHPAGSHPAGRSAWGLDDLVGNGWEWTSTVFAPFPGFTVTPSYPEYSADFFDNDHFVIKGASPATARELLRPTFRNWFRPRYPYVYATFRCVRHDGA